MCAAVPGCAQFLGRASDRRGVVRPLAAMPRSSARGGDERLARLRPGCVLAASHCGIEDEVKVAPSVTVSLAATIVGSIVATKSARASTTSGAPLSVPSRVMRRPRRSHALKYASEPRRSRCRRSGLRCEASWPTATRAAAVFGRCSVKRNLKQLRVHCRARYHSTRDSPLPHSTPGAAQR